jgi:hypothetical protein
MSNDPSDRFVKQLEQRSSMVRSFFAEMQYEKAAKDSITHIKFYRRYRQSTQIGDVQSFCTLGIMLFNGLLDYANLRSVLTVKGWYRKRRVTELAWDLAHDAEDRLFGKGIDFTEDFAEYLRKGIEHVKHVIQEYYGEGNYISPEIVSDYLSCTVCGVDIRRCNHIPGRIYDGKRCQLSPKGNLSVRCVAIVKNPTDPRCRIWPWNVDDTGDSEFGSMSDLRLMGVTDIEGDCRFEQVVNVAELAAEPDYDPDAKDAVGGRLPADLTQIRERL